MPNVDIDDDVQQAVVSLWQNTGQLFLLTGPLKAGRLPAGQKSTYAAVSVVKGKASERMTGDTYHDYRNVKLEVRGTKADVSKAIGLMLDTFNLGLGDPTKSKTLTMPSGARFIRWWPLDDGSKVLEETQKSGNEIWRGTVSGEVWTVRHTGGN